MSFPLTGSLADSEEERVVGRVGLQLVLVLGVAGIVKNSGDRGTMDACGNCIPFAAGLERDNTVRFEK